MKDPKLEDMLQQLQREWDSINISYYSFTGLWRVCESTTQDGVFLNAYTGGTLYAAVWKAIQKAPRLCDDCNKELDAYGVCNFCAMQLHDDD